MCSRTVRSVEWNVAAASDKSSLKSFNTMQSSVGANTILKWFDVDDDYVVGFFNDGVSKQTVRWVQNRTCKTHHAPHAKSTRHTVW